MTTPRRYVRRVAALLLVSGLVASGAMMAGTAGPAAAAPEPTTAESDQGKLMMVLDSSGSMAEPAGGGQTRIEAARQALNSTVDGLPDQAQVGMRVYGATVESKAKEPSRACRDSQGVVPIGTDNRDQLRNQIGAYKPFGETPTAYALKQAAKDLGGEGRRSIVLVSDGEANCAPDPCQVAADLATQGIDLKIDVVGFNVNTKAREQLRCIADKGNGSYYDAKNTDDLTTSLDKLSTRAFRPFELTGQPTDLAESSTEPPELGAGQYLTTLAAKAQDRYAIIRKKPGTSLWISATAKAPNDEEPEEHVLSLELTTLEGKRCTFGGSLPASESGNSSVFSAAMVLDPHTGSSWEQAGCGAADRLLLRVRNGEDFDTSSNADRVELRSELVVIEEPPVPEKEQQQLPGPDKGFADRDNKPSWTKPKKTVGGTSISNATTLTPSTYTDTILTGETDEPGQPGEPGETLTYRVRLDYGQRAEFAIRFAKLGKAEQDALMGFGTARVDAFSPYRGQLTNGAQMVDVRGLGDEGTGLTTPEVRYLNRSSDGIGASLAGYYYFTVHVSNRGGQVAIPFEFDIDVEGKPQGAPAYAGQAEIKGPIGGTGDQGAGAPERPNEKQTTTAPQAKEQKTSDGTGLPNWLTTGLGSLAIVLLLAAAILLFLRARRQ